MLIDPREQRLSAAAARGWSCYPPRAMFDQRRIAATGQKARRGDLPAASGEMPRQSIGGGQPCDGCGETIHPVERFFYVSIRGRELRFHDVCYGAWKGAWRAFQRG